MSTCSVTGYVESVVGGLEAGILIMFPWVIRIQRKMNATRPNTAEQVRDKWEKEKGQGG